MQVCLAEDDEVIQALSSNRTDQAFNIGVLPGRSRCRRAIPDAHSFGPPLENFSIGAIAIANYVFWRRVPRKGLRDLTGDPVSRRIASDSDMNQLAPFMAYDEESE